jgi:glycosyltransferase involved in cell wall biosynthesis
MNDARVRVSIVIPAYNEERHLRPCLEAIAAQTVQPYEVIVVDNDSTDKTAGIAQSFPFVRLVSEAQQGIVFARNAGFNAATGDIIGRIDADIELPSNWVAHVQQFYADPAHSSTAWTGCGSFYNVRLPRLVSWAYVFVAFRVNKLLLGHYTLWGSSMAITASHWQDVGSSVCLRTDIHEDLDLAIHLANAGYPIVYDSSIKVKAELRRVHSDRHKLWDYLGWLPRTLRIHHKKAWPITWFVGVFLLYQAAQFLAGVDYLAKKIRR